LFIYMFALSYWIIKLYCLFICLLYLIGLLNYIVYLYVCFIIFDYLIGLFRKKLKFLILVIVILINSNVKFY
jgi:hypothetical protein